MARVKDGLVVEFALRRLLDQGLDEATILSVEKEIDETVSNSVKRAKATARPGPERLHHGIFYEKD